MLPLDYFLKLPADRLPGPHVVRVFPADEIFKHFEVGGRRIIDADTNPRIWAVGRFARDGTFVIQMVESIPRPTRPLRIAPPPDSFPMMLYLREGMYVVPGVGERLPYDLSGTPLEVRSWSGKDVDKLGLIEAMLRPGYETVWRVVFRRSPGRPKGTPEYSSQELVAVMMKVLQEMIKHEPHKRPTKTAVAKAIGKSYRQLQTWLVAYNIDFDTVCASIFDEKK